MEAGLSVSRTVCCPEVHYESVAHWWEKVRYADLCVSYIILAADCVALQVRVWQVHSLQVFQQDRRNSKYFHAFDKCGNLENS